MVKNITEKYDICGEKLSAGDKILFIFQNGKRTILQKGIITGFEPNVGSSFVIVNAEDVAYEVASWLSTTGIKIKSSETKIYKL